VKKISGFAIAIVAVLVLVLAGCGGKKDTSGGTGNNSISPSASIGASGNSQTTTPPNSTQGGTTVAPTEKKSEADVVGVTEDGKKIVLKYIGDSPEYGAARQYLVMKGFENDGAVDMIMGTTRYYCFYNDTASYEAGLAEAGKAGAMFIKEQDAVSLYFVTSATFPNDWRKFADIVARVDAHSGQDSYSPDYDVVR